MNIEIANRLVELRKKNGLSQEELAARLGLSRQAVSKWERAESSPDTDNLICLAKLYNVSLDELLNTDESIEQISTEVKEKEEEKKELERSAQSDEKAGTDKKDEAAEKEKRRVKRISVVEGVLASILYLCATIVYFTVSSFNSEQWGKLWVIYLTPVIITSLLSCIKHRRIGSFLYPVFIVFVFLTVGMYTGVWHPTWILFLTVPVFYSVVGPIDHSIAQKRGGTETVQDDEDDDKDEDDEDEKDDKD